MALEESDGLTDRAEQFSAGCVGMTSSVENLIGEDIHRPVTLRAEGEANT